MRTYRVTRRADGAEVYRYQAEAPVEWSGMEFATHDHALVDEPAPPAAPELPPSAWHISKLAFRSRFTAAERTALTLASRQATVQGASVQTYLDDVQAAQFIDLKRPDTRAGVQGLEAAGLLAAGRAAVILDTVPNDVERFRG
jgi:hypothetical protein